MASIANTHVEIGPYVHVFQELPSGQSGCCQACKEGQAAYSWIQQNKEEILQRPDRFVCRVCASMILLVGATFQVRS